MVKDEIKKIKQELKDLSKGPIDKKEKEFVTHYLGTKKKFIGVKTGDVVRIAKKIVKIQNDIPLEEMVNLLNELFSGETIEEHLVAGKIFTLISPEKRGKIPLMQLKKWLEKTNGWVEVDVVCQSSFSAPEVISRWNDWEKTIQQFVKSDNIQVRRAGLVLQVPSVRNSNDKKIRQLAFETIDKLKAEKEVLITKAISWLLRSLVVADKEEARRYLLKNEFTLPRIAFREIMKKIETGKK